MADLDTFKMLADVAQTIKETRSTNAKISLCARYFGTFQKAENLERAARFLGEGAFANVSGRRTGIGGRTVSTCAAEFCGIDYEKVFKPCRYATGSASEAIEKLMKNVDTARQRRQPATLTLKEIEKQYEQLYRARNREEKQAILADTWRRMTPVEIKYFIRIMGRGSLRIGFETRSVAAALAKAFDKSQEEVQYVHMITGSMGKTALLCYENKLDEANFQMYQPISFMLASPVEFRNIENFTHYIAEEKFDGMRCQLHTAPEGTMLFSRDLNDITQSFPEIPIRFKDKNIPACVLDGEICVYKEDCIQPFQLLQKRMDVKKPSQKIRRQYPIIFVAFDLLYYNDRPLLGESLAARRAVLREVCQKHQISVTRQFEIDSAQQVDKLFNQALEHGNEGLMLKKKDSRYEYGQRRKSWLKVKKPGGTLDTVIMYAHAGSGKRGGYYSDFTLGIRVAEDERYEEEFIPIGKAYGGYTDEEMKKLNRRLKELVAEKYGPTLGLIPNIVVELEFDDIQVNKRTKANYTLRLPRFKAIRWDLGPKDADTLKEVERLYQQKLDKERTPQSQNPSFTLY